MRLEKWFIGKSYNGGDMIYGYVYDNPRFPDGDFVHTSRVVELDANLKWCKTLNSTYELGEINTEYDKVKG